MIIVITITIIKIIIINNKKLYLTLKKHKQIKTKKGR